MTAACQPYVFLFADGILTRYDRKENPTLKVITSLPDGSLSELAPGLSESFLHCPAEGRGYDPGDQCITLTFSKSSPSGHRTSEIAKQKVFAVAPLTSPPNSLGKHGVTRPMPRISVRNEFDVMLEGEMLREDGTSGRQFVLRSRVRLPLGWEAIELFPPYRSDVWDPSIAWAWAEADLLASALRTNLLDDHFRALDPYSEARKRTARLLTTYESFLAGPEEPLHQFLRDNPYLLCPTQIAAWSKLPLGKRDTDFVFRDAAGDYLLVELERPSHQLFRRDGQQREPLTHAIDQVIDWVRYLEDNLTTVQREMGLHGISTSPRCLVVIGRSRALTAEGRRKLVTIENQHPRLKIATYDDVLALAKASAENLLGPLWDPGPNAEFYLLS